MDLIRTRNDGWLAALLGADPEQASEYLHRDYALDLAHPAPAVAARDEWLRTLPDYLISRWDVQQSIFDVQGRTAVHLELVDMWAKVFGAERNRLFAISDIWLMDDDDMWRVWRRHSTPLSAGPILRPLADTV